MEFFKVFEHHIQRSSFFMKKAKKNWKFTLKKILHKKFSIFMTSSAILYLIIFLTLLINCFFRIKFGKKNTCKNNLLKFFYNTIKKEERFFTTRNFFILSTIVLILMKNFLRCRNFRNIWQESINYQFFDKTCRKKINFSNKMRTLFHFLKQDANIFSIFSTKCQKSYNFSSKMPKTFHFLKQKEIHIK